MNKFFKGLLHIWRIATEQSGAGWPIGLRNDWKWQVVHKDGVSIPMAYDVACDYATFFNGNVEKIKPTKGK